MGPDKKDVGLDQGGGRRTITMQKNWKYAEILRSITQLYFPSMYIGIFYMNFSKTEIKETN